MFFVLSNQERSRVISYVSLVSVSVGDRLNVNIGHL